MIAPKEIVVPNFEGLQIVKEDLKGKGLALLPFDEPETGTYGYYVYENGDKPLRITWHKFGKPLTPEILEIPPDGQTFSIMADYIGIYKNKPGFQFTLWAESMQIGFVSHCRADEGVSIVFQISIEKLKSSENLSLFEEMTKGVELKGSWDGETSLTISN